MTTTERVEAILKASKQARNSDKELWLIFAQKMGVQLSPYQVERIREMPEFETLRRVRQKLQEDGKYPAVKQVKKEREYKSQRMQQITPGASPKYIEQTLSDGRTVEVPRGYRILEDE